MAAAEAAGEEVSLDDIQAAVDAGILEVEGGIDALIESAAINEAVEQASSELMPLWLPMRRCRRWVY